ncbi:MAG: hypothetical protein ACOVOX_02305, partial [Burkholderiaceae bacterium]
AAWSARFTMADDIVTRLRAGNKHYGDLQSDATVYEEAADEIERLREWNVEITKLLKQAQVCMDIWQKSEDELIEFHQGKSIEALTKQADEIERLRAEVTRWKELAADLAMTCAINEMEGGDA